MNMRCRGEPDEGDQKHETNSTAYHADAVIPRKESLQLEFALLSLCFAADIQRTVSGERASHWFLAMGDPADGFRVNDGIPDLVRRVMPQR